MWRTGLAALRHVGSSQTRARTRVPCIGRWILNHCATREVPKNNFLRLRCITDRRKVVTYTVYLFLALNSDPTVTQDNLGPDLASGCPCPPPAGEAPSSGRTAGSSPFSKGQAAGGGTREEQSRTRGAQAPRHLRLLGPPGTPHALCTGSAGWVSAVRGGVRPLEFKHRGLSRATWLLPLTERDSQEGLRDSRAGPHPWTVPGTRGRMGFGEGSAATSHSPTGPLRGAPHYKGRHGLGLGQKLVWKMGQEGGAEARRGDGCSQPLWARGAQGASPPATSLLLRPQPAGTEVPQGAQVFLLEVTQASPPHL